MAERHEVLIAGAGGVGRAVGLLLAEWGDSPVTLKIGDADEAVAHEAAEWIRAGLSEPAPVEPFLLPREGVNEPFAEALGAADILLDCLPGSQAPRLARLAREHRLHYANLTEYVAETEEVERIAEGADTGFLLQTGLAPGFVDVLGHKLFLDFCRDFGVDRIESLRMRVGALPKIALPPHYYAFTWSPVGVATEYLEEAIVVRDWKKTTQPSLTGTATVRYGSLRLEESLTSGGAADLPDALEGRVRELDYKTLRYPGHWAWVSELIETLPGEGTRVDELQTTMERLVPAVETDQVVIYAAAEGFTSPAAGGGRRVRRRLEELLVVPPCRAGRHTLRAIQSTTAAGLAESARLLLAGGYRGVVLQSQIEPDAFLEGTFVRRAYYDPAAG